MYKKGKRMRCQERPHLQRKLIEEDEADVEDNSEEDEHPTIQAETIPPPKSDHESPSPLRELFKKRVIKMEGEHRIVSITLLRYTPLKSVFLCCLLALSVVGLLLLKYSKKARKTVNYKEVEDIDQATHIFIKGEEQDLQISKIQRIRFNQTERLVFSYKELRYEVHGHSCLPLSYPYAHQLEHYLGNGLLSSGLTNQTAKQRLFFYGNNQHVVRHLPFYRKVIRQLLTPLFLYLLLCSLTHFLEGYFQDIILIGMTYTSVVVRERTSSVKREKKRDVKVLREGEVANVHPDDLAPGDLFYPEHSIPCDAILLKGEMSVNEGPLTGETFPHFKLPLQDPSKVHDKSHWILEGSQINSVKAGTIAVSVHGGFGTRRGRILRNEKSESYALPQLHKRLLCFQIEPVCVALLLLVVALWRMQHYEVDAVLKVFRLVDFVAWGFPPAFLLLFNIADICCSLRLDYRGIIKSRSCYVGGARLQTLCFDKTGTLTEDCIELSSVFSVDPSTREVKEEMEKELVPATIADLLGTCHSILIREGELEGNSIDLSLFQYSGASFRGQESQGSTRIVEVRGQEFQIIRVNPFSSAFQSVSVLCQSVFSNRTYIFVKGSPESLHSCSPLKLPSFDTFLKEMGIKGFRVLGLGFKEIGSDEIDRYIASDRVDFQAEVELIGFATLKDQIREEAKNTIRTIIDRGISPRIVTGDNIYSAVRVAFESEIISQHQTVAVIQGHHYDAEGAGALLTELTYLHGTITSSTRKVDWFSYNTHGADVYAIDHEFIKKNPHHFFSDKVKVFARIPAEEKAHIIDKYKEHYRILVANQKCFGAEPRGEVGMVGDGTNDRMAVETADLGIALRGGDACERAHFEVRDLSHIPELLQETQQNEYNTFKMVQHFTLSQLLLIVCSLILEEDCAFLTSLEQTLSFGFILLFLAIGLAMQRGKRTPQHLPLSLQVFTLQKHLLYWCPFLLLGIGVTVNAVLYSESQDYSPNSEHPWADFQDGWFGHTKSTTMTFLAFNLATLWLLVGVQVSTPQKTSLKSRLPLLVIFSLELLLVVYMSFWSQHFEWIDLQPLQRTDIVWMWAIVGASGVVMTILGLGTSRLLRRSQSLGSIPQDSILE